MTKCQPANQKYGDQVATIDSEIEQWQGRLERLYDFIETRAIEPETMAEGLALLQDRIAELRQARIDMEEDRVLPEIKSRWTLKKSCHMF